MEVEQEKKWVLKVNYDELCVLHESLRVLKAEHANDGKGMIFDIANAMHGQLHVIITA